MKLSVVIITYNRYKDLKECLDSIFKMHQKPYEVIVVDSNSRDGTDTVKNKYPIEFISIPQKNMQKARNVGIFRAKGEIVAFLDDDVVVDKNWSKYILEPYKDRKVGGVGGRVINYGASPESYVKLKDAGVGRVFKNGLVLGNFDTLLAQSIEVDCFIGCNMSFRRELLLKIGGCDEKLKGNCFRDDTDLCLRIKNLGYKLIFQPKALVWHKFRGKQITNEWIYWYVRNNTYFYLKNIFPKSRLRFPFFLYRMFFPPKDYVQKSGVKIKKSPKIFPTALVGLYHGIKAYKSKT
ncbi:MAG: glycosyltransferase family 2 protein [Candidatus Bathyarchaeia archaeon]